VRGAVERGADAVTDIARTDAFAYQCQ